MSAAELYASVGLILSGLILAVLLPRGRRRSRAVELQVGTATSLGIVGLTLLALYLNGFEYF